MAGKWVYGQFFSGEFILGFIIFTLALGITLTLWDTSMRDALSGENIRDMDAAGVDAAETLARTEGVPSDWNSSNVVSLGLANESSIITSRKVREFVHYMSINENDSNCTKSTNCVYNCTVRNYECNLHMLGLGGYDFYFNLSHQNGTTVDLNGTAALTGRPPINESDMVTVVRSMIMDDEIVSMYLTVWK